MTLGKLRPALWRKNALETSSNITSTIKQESSSLVQLWKGRIVSLKNSDLYKTLKEALRGPFQALENLSRTIYTIATVALMIFATYLTSNSAFLFLAIIPLAANKDIRDSFKEKIKQIWQELFPYLAKRLEANKIFK